LVSDSANIIIENASTVETTAECSDGYAQAILASGNIIIDSAAAVTANAESSGDECDAYGLYCSQNITITNASAITATVNSTHGSAYSMYAYHDLVISSSEVQANATSTTILADPYSEPCATALYGTDSLHISGSSKVTAVANTTGTARAFAVYACEGDILIDGDSDIHAIADGVLAGFAFFVDDYYCEGATLTITDCRKIVAEGTNSSFVIRPFVTFDISQLQDSHRFANAETPITYSQMCNDWYFDEDTSLNSSNYTNVTITKATLITLDSRGGNGGSTVTNALKGNSSLVPAVIAPTRTGYVFQGWHNETVGGVMFVNTTGTLEKNVSGYTDSERNWINTSDALTLYANWTVYSVKNESLADTGSAKVATFNDTGNVVKIVAIQNASTAVTAVDITYEPETAGPSSDGSCIRKTLSPVFNITLTGNLGSDNATVTFNLTVSELNGTSPDTVYLAHKKNGAWEYLKPCYIQTGDIYTFTVTGITSFSPFVPISMTTIPYTPSSSSHSGGSVILQPGQTAPTLEPTVSPTAAPTSVPPASTRDPNQLPTAQSTQASPAPFAGILLGLGVAAALLTRLRR
ncbi:MAG TPA: hypothetical protein O0X27_00110, partial [Methanocorpusculum sp.]|nr:hypothetical protein [Methanocorpusculum sp.]